ncbi:unnamed protein product [Prunus brigantina]
MMNSQLQKLNHAPSFSLLPKSSIHTNYLIRHGSPSLINILPRCPVRQNDHNKKNSSSCVVIRASSGELGSSAAVSTLTTTITSTENKAVSVKAVVTVTAAGFLSSIVTSPLDEITDLLGKTLLLELVSAELDPKTGLEKDRIKGQGRSHTGTSGYAHKASHKDDEVIYESNFTIPAGFGAVGAIEVENEHHKETFIKTIDLQGFPNGSVNVPCNSWVHAKFDNPQKRIFFTNKSYIPSETPSGLKRLRELELENLRGNGEGERKTSDRIYDYDTYNDLGDPDSKDELARPVLGSKEHPYPRRCRTGRPRAKKDPLSEKRSSSVYVPRDEAFAEVKQLTFSAKTLKSVLHALLPSLETALLNPELGFPYFTAIDSLFNEGVTLPKPKTSGFFQTIIPRLVKTITAGGDDLLLLEN